MVAVNLKEDNSSPFSFSINGKITILKGFFLQFRLIGEGKRAIELTAQALGEGVFWVQTFVRYSTPVASHTCTTVI